MANGKKDKKKPSEQEFIERFKVFDTKFATKMKDYITGVYNRLAEFPYSQ